MKCLIIVIVSLASAFMLSACGNIEKKNVRNSRLPKSNKSELEKNESQTPRSPVYIACRPNSTEEACSDTVKALNDLEAQLQSLKEKYVKDISEKNKEIKLINESRAKLQASQNELLASLANAAVAQEIVLDTMEISMLERLAANDKFVNLIANSKSKIDELQRSLRTAEGELSNCKASNAINEADKPLICGVKAATANKINSDLQNEQIKLIFLQEDQADGIKSLKSTYTAYDTFLKSNPSLVRDGKEISDAQLQQVALLVK